MGLAECGGGLETDVLVGEGSWRWRRGAERVAESIAI